MTKGDPDIQHQSPGLLLVVIDNFSRFPGVEIKHSTSANTVIPKLDAIFARHGKPVEIRIGNGPSFKGEIF